MERRNFLAAGGASVLGSLLASCGGGSSTDLAQSEQEGSGEGSSTPAPSPSPSPAPAPAPSGPAKARVLVVGGGMAGATVAKYLRLWGDSIEVTLVEPSATYTSCILSSLVLTGQRTLSSLQFSYSTLAASYGVIVKQDTVTGIEPGPSSVTVTLANGGRQAPFDRVVLAPGIQFDDVPGLGAADALKMPHAWKAGDQTTALAAQLQAMAAGDTVVLTVPKTPYRCPPGPYERACLLADWLSKNKRGSKLLVLDANPGFVTEADNFGNAFSNRYAGIVEYITNAEVQSADAATMSLTTTMGTFSRQNSKIGVVNLIPTQRAGSLLATAGLNNATNGRFGGVNVLSYASTVPGADRVHIIGDASATTQPKAGHIANQEAKVCADAISRLLTGGQPDPGPVTNSSCYSTITMQEASWLHAVFQYDGASSSMVAQPAASGASVGWSSDGFKDMNTWFRALMADTFA